MHHSLRGQSYSSMCTSKDMLLRVATEHAEKVEYIYLEVWDKAFLYKATALGTVEGSRPCIASFFAWV